MKLKLNQLKIDGHSYSQIDIADMAEKILSDGYRQHPPIVVGGSNYGTRRILDGTLRFLALQYIRKYHSTKVILGGIECIQPQVRCGPCDHIISKGER